MYCTAGKGRFHFYENIKGDLQVDHFKLHSKYKPTGDQPQAIEELVRGFREGNQFETLLGVTGSVRPLRWRTSSNS